MPEDAMDILRALAVTYPITGADMMEIAPFTDSCGQGVAGQEKTLKIGADISAFLLKEMAK
jgi:agmatinase